MGILAAAYPITATVLATAATSYAASELLAPKPPQAPAPPPIAPPTAMPTPGDAKSAAARRLSIVEQRKRMGRASTILTDTSVGLPDSDTLG